MKQKKKKTPSSYQKRSYRNIVDPSGLVSSYVTVRQTDLHILAPAVVEEQAYHFVYQYRNQLENYIASLPDFLTALLPLPLDPLSPPMVREMLKAAAAAGVGPMAAVAGAIAEFVGRDLLAAGQEEVIVENGGDIFLSRKKECTAAIFAGESPLSNQVGLRIKPGQMPLGICTSSGTVGHSLSFGKADAVTVLARSTLLADAAATRLGNEVKDKRDINKALGIAEKIPGLMGVVIIKDRELGAWGEVELV